MCRKISALRNEITRKAPTGQRTGIYMQTIVSSARPVLVNSVPNACRRSFFSVEILRSSLSFDVLYTYSLPGLN